jgi:DNA-binding SARP family transcriptional activator
MSEFRLLGPFEGPVPLPGGKPKALLARLLLDVGRVVSTGTLVEALWESPPPSAAKVLQAHVVALRKALGAEAIETRGKGYVLRRGSSDLAALEQLAERARVEPDARRRSTLLREALALWRGEPLAEFRREPFAQSAGRRLRELHVAVLERRIDADLELGRHEELVPELTSLVAEEPLREPLRRQLMLALYRSGRQVDALATYREGRRLLVDALGIEPGRTLQELERAILRHDPALDVLDGTGAAGDRRGAVICIGCAPLGLVGPLEREVIVVELVREGSSLATAAARLEGIRGIGVDVRTACFTSTDGAADAARLAHEQDAELLLVTSASPEFLAHAPCDVAVLHEPAPFEPRGPIVAPFGGGKEEWPALELAAWLARAHGLPFRLLGVEAHAGRRDASRTLAAASLALQRFAGIVAEPVVAAAGIDGLLAAGGSVIVVSLPADGIDPTRRELVERSAVPVLLVHGGLRPSGLAPDRTLTRFSWTAAPDGA